MIERAACELRPVQSRACDKGLEAIGAPVRRAVLDFVNPPFVERGNKRGLNFAPVLANAVCQRQIERHAARLLLRRRPTEFRAQIGMRQRADGRQKTRREPGERVDIVAAISQDGLRLSATERRAGQDAIAHVALARDVDSVGAEIAQRAVE
jgi:hypothetical protein